MNFDLRFPIGIMFSLLGVILVGYGAMSDKSIYDAHSLGININLIWGFVLLAFGVFMFIMAWRGRKAGSTQSSKESGGGKS